MSAITERPEILQSMNHRNFITSPFTAQSPEKIHYMFTILGITQKLCGGKGWNFVVEIFEGTNLLGSSSRMKMPFLRKYFVKKKGKGGKERLQGKYKKRENTTEILEGTLSNPLFRWECIIKKFYPSYWERSLN